jgi:hypothetical protein
VLEEKEFENSKDFLIIKKDAEKNYQALLKEKEQHEQEVEERYQKLVNEFRELSKKVDAKLKEYHDILQLLTEEK